MNVGLMHHDPRSGWTVDMPAKGRADALSCAHCKAVVHRASDQRFERHACPKVDCSCSTFHVNHPAEGA